MKFSYSIFVAILTLSAGYYFYSSSPQTQKQELSSTESSAKADEETSGEKEVDYDEMTPEQQTEFAKDNGLAEVKAAEAEYAIEKAPEHSDGYDVVEQFTDDSGDLMAQALAN